jgi:cobalamin biosynthesis protein CobT
MIPQLPRVDRIKPNEPGLVDESRCITITSRMRAKLMGLLQAVKRLPERFGVSGRKLAVNRLVRMATGDPRIFRKRIESVAVNTAVVVLLDRSGSMIERDGGSQSRIAVAREAAFSLHHTLSGITGVAVHSIAFDMIEKEQETPPIKVLCNWGEKPRSEHFGVSAREYTPTPWALWYARVELLVRPEPRKVVLLVTDGEPFGWDGIEADTLAATDRLYRDGIEIAAIGIETDSVQDYWKNNRVIKDLDELPQAMFAVMTDLLTRKAA